MRRPIGNAITQDSRALWLGMRSQGGWWTVKSLVLFWSPTFAEYEVIELLTGLIAGGYVASREMTRGQVSYAVTSACAALPGLQPAQWREAA